MPHTVRVVMSNLYAWLHVLECSLEHILSTLLVVWSDVMKVRFQHYLRCDCQMVVRCKSLICSLLGRCCDCQCELCSLCKWDWWSHIADRAFFLSGHNCRVVLLNFTICLVRNNIQDDEKGPTDSWAGEKKVEYSCCDREVFCTF